MNRLSNMKDLKQQDSISRDLPRVALFVETSRAYGRRIFEGIHAHMRETSPWLVTASPRSLTDPLPAWLDEWDGDGIIARVADEASVARLRKTGIPLVLLKQSSILHHKHEIPAKNDHRAIGRVAAEHLIGEGFVSFAFVGLNGLVWSDKRLEGFSAELDQLGVGPIVFEHPDLCSEASPESAAGKNLERLIRWIQSLPTPCGIFAADDFIGRDVLNACRLAGRYVPEEIGVVGVDDESSVAELGYPGLSSVVPDNVRVGRMAAARLADLMSARGAVADVDWEEPLMIPPLEVMVRESSADGPVQDAMLAKAIRLIRERACEGLTVAEVTERLGVSASTLQRKMRRERGRSVHSLIQETRLRQAKLLLEKTDLPIKQVAAAVGFESQEHFIPTFKKHIGKTPHSWRTERRMGRSMESD